MPKIAATTQADILKAGQEAFLEKGFKDASLRDIAAAAGVTTGAIYGYYPDKAALFAALVRPHADYFKHRFDDAQEGFARLPQADQIAAINTYSTGELAHMLDYVYQHFDAFKLLVCSSAGTEFENYIDTLVEMETDATLRFLAVLRQNGYAPVDMPKNLLHLLNNAYFSAIFETVAHNMSHREASEYVEHITAFFTAGWGTVLRIE